jgi:hypothetical protein
MANLSSDIADTRNFTDDDFTAADQVPVGTAAGSFSMVTLAASQFLAKKAAGAATNVTAAEARTILNVENGADVTDATNVAAAGAVMDADFTAANEVMVGTGAGTHSQVTLSASQILGRKATGDTTNLSASDVRTILQTTSYADCMFHAGLFQPDELHGPAPVPLLGSNKQARMLLFSPTVEQYAYYTFRMPDDYDGSTVKCKVVWKPTSTASASDVVLWGVSLGACGNDDAFDAALGTEVEISDTVIAVGDLHISDATAAITASGTPAAGEVFTMKIARKAADGSDTMDDEDAALVGVAMQWGVTAASPAAW